MGIVAFEQADLIRFGNDRHLEFAAQFPAHLAQRADTGLQSEYRTVTLAIDLDLPREIDVGIDTILLPCPGDKNGMTRARKIRAMMAAANFMGM